MGEGCLARAHSNTAATIKPSPPLDRIDFSPTHPSLFFSPAIPSLSLSLSLSISAGEAEAAKRPESLASCSARLTEFSSSSFSGEIEKSCQSRARLKSSRVSLARGNFFASARAYVGICMHVIHTRSLRMRAASGETKVYFVYDGSQFRIYRARSPGEARSARQSSVRLYAEPHVYSGGNRK